MPPTKLSPVRPALVLSSAHFALVLAFVGCAVTDPSEERAARTSDLATASCAGLSAELCAADPSCEMATRCPRNRFCSMELRCMAKEPVVAADAGAPPDPVVPPPACVRVQGGCNGDLCLESGTSPGLSSDCMVPPEYPCVTAAVCERQSDGTCGWTDNGVAGACAELREPTSQN